MVSKTKLGFNFFDDFLNGGFDNDIVTTIYGAAGSGKSNICLILVNSFLSDPKNDGKKVIFIDTEGGLSIDRLKQLNPNNYNSIVERLLVLKPTTFQEQIDAFNKLRLYKTDNVGLIIVDSMAMLYRIEMGQTKNIFEINGKLSFQISSLMQITRKHNIPIIITNQVYSSFDDKNKYSLVGGDILKYWSKCLIELNKYDDYFEATIIKHRCIKEGTSIKFTINDRGLLEYNGSNNKSNNVDENKNDDINLNDLDNQLKKYPSAPWY